MVVFMPLQHVAYSSWQNTGPLYSEIDGYSCLWHNAGVPQFSHSKDIFEKSQPVLVLGEELSVLLSSATIRKTISKNEVLIRHGDEAETLWLLLSGWVKLVRQTPNGHETIIGLCTGFDLFGEAALFPHGHYPYYAETLTECTFALVPAKILREIVDANTAISKQLMALLGERIQQAQLKLEQLSTLSAPQRLACFLLRLCKSQNDSHHIHIPVDKQIIASFLGMKPETLSRSFKQLKAQGISVKIDALTISSVANLRSFVCSSCSESGMCDAEEKL